MENKLLQNRITEVRCEILQSILFDFRWSDEEDTDEDKIWFRRCFNIIKLWYEKKITKIKTIKDLDYTKDPIKVKEEFLEMIKMANDIADELIQKNYDFWNTNRYPFTKEYIRKNKDKYKINFPKNIINI